jgi:D-alanyl-D-alanine carboxypeptidase/D-alanyl-D-alanine-endopeptidase (penicillin-binding protein 4)
VVLSAENGETLRYAGHLIRHFLVAAGVKTEGAVRAGAVRREKDRLIHRFLSPYSLDEVTKRLLEFSNNFIANQCFIAVGIAASGPPGTLDKGRAAARSFAAEVLKIPGIRVDEGSGISRENRVTAFQMLKILEAFAPHYRLMKREGREWFKTGSLSGVKTRAGYLAGEGGLYRFVVFVNTAGRGTGPVMRAIHRAVPGPS